MDITVGVKLGTFYQEALRLSKEAFCEVTEVADNFYQAFRAVTNSSLPNLSFPGAANQLLCDRPPPPADPGFQGGQCEGVAYLVTIRITSVTRILGDPSTDRRTVQTSSVRVFGKVLGLRAEGTSSTGLSPIFVRTSTGEVLGYSGSVGGGVSIVSESAGIVSVVREDGQDDNCGNPPPTSAPPPPGWNQRPFNFTFDPPGGTSITLPVIIAIGYANVGIDGTFNIPISFNFNLNPEFNFDWDWDPFGNKGKPRDPFNPKPNDPDCTPQPPKSDPDSPPTPDPDEPPTDPPTPPTDPVKKVKLIRAAIVTVTDFPDAVGQLFQGRAPDIALPNYGYINFQVQVGRDFFWLPDQPVKNKRTLIPCEWEYGATLVVGEPRPGVAWRITPVYIEREIPKGFPSDTVGI